jgi:predicted metal-dependent phosphotriesterase family hydrolase
VNMVVRTVLGDIAPADLGITATHEHLWCDQRLCRDPTFPRPQNKMLLNDLEMVVDEVGWFTRAGGRAIVEVTVAGWKRDVGKLAEIARRTGIHVVATSGYYVESCHPAFVAEADIAELEDALVREMTEGADGTTIRPGLLKAATSRPLIEDVEERCTRAVARAHHRTGAAITTHTSGGIRFHIDGGNAGDQFLRIFEEEGVDPNRVIIGHCDENADVRQLASLMRQGAYVEFDVLGKSHWLLDETRVDLVVELVDRGFANRLLLATDRNRVHELHVGGGPGYDHVLARFVPRLKERGIDEPTLDLMLVRNPAEIFTIPVR